MSADSWLISLETERSASSWNIIGGSGVVVDVDVLPLGDLFILLSNLVVDGLGTTHSWDTEAEDEVEG